MQLPIFKKLYQVNGNGKIKEWEISVVMGTTFPEIIKIYGLQGSKKVVAKKLIKAGKNIGKANETTPLEQAILEANSDYLKKLDSAYTENLNVPRDSAVPKLPMLAVKFTEREHNIMYPCKVQPKLDGIRCTLFQGNLYSRKNKLFYFMDHILNLYKGIPKNIVLDGELYSDTVSFQQIVSIVKQKNNPPPKELLNQIKLYVFDCYDNFKPKLDFIDRLELVKMYVDPSNIVLTKDCKNKAELERYYHTFLDKKYEGIMIRNNLGPYIFNKRSKDLQKLKPFEDAEFQIVGFKEGTGTDAGTVIWECITKEMNTFTVRPKGTREERKELFKNGKKFIGKWITVKYQELTDDGKPRFPSTLQDSVVGYMRDYE